MNQREIDAGSTVVPLADSSAESCPILHTGGPPALLTVREQGDVDHDQSADAGDRQEPVMKRDPWWLYATMVVAILLTLASTAGHVWQFAAER